jgi:phosphoribosyl 1,2-cyclic phosphate phosphodiesterase
MCIAADSAAEDDAGPVELLFLGTGTSAGVPMIGCHCDVCTSADPRDRRTRPSVVISRGGTRVLVDTSPELRLQCVANGVDGIDAVVVTHGHADHIMGLDDVRRFNALRGGPLDVWAEPATREVLDRSFGYAFRPPDPDAKVFRPHLVHRDITDLATPITFGPMAWQPIRLFHGRMPVLGFRVGRLAYCTDVNRIPDESWPLLEGLDLLVLDALAPKPHSTHFSLPEAVAVVERVKPKRARFTHIAHQLPHAATNAALPPNVQLAYDGERITAGG